MDQFGRDYFLRRRMSQQYEKRAEKRQTQGKMMAGKSNEARDAG
jgi:hypothetical protein